MDKKKSGISSTAEHSLSK